MIKTDVVKNPRGKKLSEEETELLGFFEKLSARGKKEALKRVIELASLDKYKRLVFFAGDGNEKNSPFAFCGTYAVQHFKR